MVRSILLVRKAIGGGAGVHPGAIRVARGGEQRMHMRREIVPEAHSVAWTTVLPVFAFTASVLRAVLRAVCSVLEQVVLFHPVLQVIAHAVCVVSGVAGKRCPVRPVHHEAPVMIG